MVVTALLYYALMKCFVVGRVGAYPAGSAAAERRKEELPVEVSL